ncbi:MAG: hypothetical protein RIC36_06630 [Rhodospirillales bacterium]
MTDQIKVDQEKARQGETSGRMRKVVISSTVLAVVVVAAAVYFSG